MKKMGAEKSLYGGDEGPESDPELFAQVAATPSQWLGQAGDHLYTAQLLLPHVEQRHALIRHCMETKQKVPALPPSVAEPYFMHCAFSLENSFKCVIAAQRAEQIRQEVRKTKSLPKVLLGHDLVDLASRAAFTVGIDHEHMLTFLSRYGTWAGRYPLSVRNADYGLTEQLSDGKHYLVGGYRHDQVAGFVAFCSTVYKWVKEKVSTLTVPDPVSQQSQPT
jgi:hypothetical protein